MRWWQRKKPSVKRVISDHTIKKKKREKKEREENAIDPLGEREWRSVERTSKSIFDI